MTPMIDAMERMKVIAARINKGQDSYAGRQDAWHKLGAVSGEFQTWKEMIEAAKADFEVFKDRLEWNGELVNAWGAFRQDRGTERKAAKFLGTVGEDYEVIQHTDGFELLDELVGQVDGAHYETMGTLDFGGIVWGQVDPNIDIRVGDDVSTIFLSFITSHNGSKAFDIYETAVRQVCRNTVRVGSLKRLASSLRVKHTKNAHKRIENLKAEIAEIRTVAMTMQERLQFLASKKVTRERLDSIMDRLFPKKDQEVSSTRRDNILADVMAVYEDNDNNAFPEQRGTAYNLLNAITNYTDHTRSTKGDMRAESALFGSGDKLKTNALQVILDEAEGMPVMLERVSFESTGLQIR